MKPSEEESTSDIEALLQGKGRQLASSLLRRFACECCRRVAHLCSDPIYVSLLEFVAARASGTSLHDELTALRSDAIRSYDALYPGYGSPSAAVLALTAVGE